MVSESLKNILNNKSKREAFFNGIDKRLKKEGYELDWKIKHMSSRKKKR